MVMPRGTRDTRVIRKNDKSLQPPGADSCVATRPHAKARAAASVVISAELHHGLQRRPERRAKDRAGNHRKSTPFTASRDDRFDGRRRP